MKIVKHSVLLLGIGILVFRAHPADFSSGSTGADGALNVATNTTLNLPPNGIFNFTTITVAQGATLTFKRNALNTPAYLLATGDVEINGIINISGKAATFGKGGEGGPGGFDGGAPANGQLEQPADGLGPGGGKGFPSDGRPASYDYGNTILVPLIGGSGGGGGLGGMGGGGGGGGAILIASTTRITMNTDAIIISNAGIATSAQSYAGDGSGGAIRLVANEVRGQGGLSCYSPEGNGLGRARVDALVRYDLSLKVLNSHYTVGKYMHVFPPNSPSLIITQAAGTAISDLNSVASIVLPVGSPTNQTVTIQARNFTGVVPITVAVIPEAGPSTRYDAQIDTAGSPTAQSTVKITLVPDTKTTIQAWTR